MWLLRYPESLNQILAGARRLPRKKENNNLLGTTTSHTRTHPGKSRVLFENLDTEIDHVIKRGRQAGRQAGRHR